MIDLKDVGLKEKEKCMCEGFLKRLSACMWLWMECYEVVFDEKDTESKFKGKPKEMKSPAGKRSVTV